jgi:transcriptional regulator with XRE-family HTH domain
MKKMSSLEDKYIGNRLKLRRSQLGVSQTQLAKFEKLTFQQVQKYESGVNKIASGRLYRFARILHVPMSYFYEGIEDVIEAQEGSKSAKAKVEATKMDASTHADLRKLNLFFLKIKKSDLRKSVVTLAKSLALVDAK